MRERLTTFAAGGLHRLARRWKTLAVLAVLVLAAVWAVADYLLERPLDTAPYLAAPSSPELCDREGRLLYPFLNADEQWCFTRELEQFSPKLVQATIAVEDQRFRRHGGVDAFAVVRAVLQNAAGRRVVSGASTLTMQTVKLAGVDARSMRGKFSQAWLALRLERHTDKDAILSAYLNKAPYGMNLVGAEAAARRYFGKPAVELTLAEAALLAGMPKAPARFDPLRRPENARARRGHVLGRMLAEGFISEAAHAAAAEAPLGAAWHDFPDLAPHLAMTLRDTIRERGRVRVLLDGPLQQRVRGVLRGWLTRYRGDVTNAAAIVIDVASGEVLVRVGGADFHGAPAGQVDLCAAARSPGSALKPFAYALALDAGVLYPSEMLLDDTLDYGAYNPGNFDGGYRGLVSASDALADSLNVPALTVLQRVGAGEMLRMLRACGLGTVRATGDHYGLGLVLGNCEARLEELAGAYAALAALGEYRAPRLFHDTPAPPPKRVFSRGTALELFRMLEQPFPAGIGGGFVYARGGPPRVCWKTGTSTGFHDAWTFMFDRQYVVGVWLGNNGGRSSRQLVGAHAARPLAARIFRMLPARPTPSWPDAGGAMRPVRICAETGLPASEWCAHVTETLFARDRFLNRRCDVHRPAGDGGVRAVWPGGAARWDLASVRVPETRERAGESAPLPAKALAIQSPSHLGVYVYTGEADGDRIPLRASVDDRAPVHWFVNGRFVGTGTPAEPLLYALSPGEHVAACLTGDGRSAEASFSVVVRPEGPRAFKRQL